MPLGQDARRIDFFQRDGTPHVSSQLIVWHNSRVGLVLDTDARLREVSDDIQKGMRGHV